MSVLCGLLFRALRLEFSLVSPPCVYLHESKFDFKGELSGCTAHCSESWCEESSVRSHEGRGK